MMRLTPVNRNRNAPVGSLFEPLENRLLLAGTVTVAISGSTLTMTGDAGGNQIVIDALGLLPNQFRITGVGGTAVAGQAVVSDIQNIKANMGDGGDALTFTLAILLGGITYDGGDGTNSLTLQAFGVGKNVVYKGRGGYEEMTLGAGTVAGSVSMVGAGTVLTIDNSTVNGKVSYGNTFGAGGVTFIDSAVYGSMALKSAGTADILCSNFWSSQQASLTIKLGGGNDRFRLNNGSTLNGKLKISDGDGDNTIELNSVTALGKVTIKGGPSADTVTLTNSLVQDILFDGGAGANHLTLSNSTVNSNLRFTGGEGLDTIWLTADTGVQGDFRLDARGGNDTLTIDGATFQARTSIKMGADDDLLDIDRLTQPGVTTFVGQTTIQMGSGSDTLRLGRFVLGGGMDSVVFQGPVTMDGGQEAADWLTLDIGGDATFTLTPVIKGFEFFA